MGMSASQSADDGEPIMEINTTPLIDVMLVLLVMLIITIPIQLHAVNLNLPVGTPPASEIKPEVVHIDINSDGAVLWNGEPLLDRAQLDQRLLAVAAQAVAPEIHLRPDKRAKYQRVAETLVSINQAGLKKLGVVGAEQFRE